MVPISEDPQGAYCVVDPWGDNPERQVSWSSDCGRALAKHLAVATGPSLGMLGLIVFVAARGRQRNRRVRALPVTPPSGRLDSVLGKVQILRVDERDSHWEDDRPRFRVYLHGNQGGYTMGWTDTYDVTGADIVQVIDWAQRQAGDSLTYAVALVSEDQYLEDRNPGCGRGLVWLVGTDGMSEGTGPDEADVLRRMLARRSAPVTVPGVDRMPGGVPDPYNDGTEQR